MFATGHKLKNGAVVLKSHRADNGNIVVLAEWEQGAGGNAWHPYVTWRCDSEGNCYWGHYFGEWTKASADFAERVSFS